MSKQCAVLLIGSGIIVQITGGSSYYAYFHAKNTKDKQHFEQVFQKSVAFFFCTWLFTWLGEYVSWFLGGILIIGEVLYFIRGAMRQGSNMKRYHNRRKSYK